MPEELERELERALAGLPGPSSEASERARRSALGTLPAPDQAGRRWRAPALLVAAAAAVLVAAVSVTLAATGTPPFSPAKHHPPARPPAGAARTVHVAGTLATYVNGRLWLGRTHGRRFSAVELSPGGLYLAVGQPGRLTVYSPDMSRLVWSHGVAGTVVAISWRPIGTQIAYIVRTGGHNVLHLIQADGDTDQVVDTAVAPVTPSWRWDSQAFAYVGAGGRVAIRDLIHARTIPVRTPGPCRSEGAASSVAFAPFGRHRGWLAAALPDHVAFATDTATGRSQCFVARPSLVSTFGAGHVAWTAHGDLLMTEYQYIGRFWIARGHVLDGGYVAAPLGVASIAAAPNGEGMLVALSGHRSLTEVLAKLPPLLGHGPLRITGTVEVLPVAPPHNLSAQLLWR